MTEKFLVHYESGTNFQICMILSKSNAAPIKGSCERSLAACFFTFVNVKKYKKFPGKRKSGTNFPNFRKTCQT